ncbi:unnamed protein product [Colias eurytheme]|nr:unnamed protein product [Colias eurytheme]
MLKVCCECIFGNGTQNEVDYGTSINGQALGEMMANRENEIIFNLPTKLKQGDEFEVIGHMTSDRRRLIVALITGTYKIDHNNVACEVEFNFTGDESIKLRKIINGVAQEQIVGDISSSSLLMGMYFEKAQFKLKFKIWRTSILISVGSRMEDDGEQGDTILEPFDFDHNIDDIKFLSLSNDIEKVSNLNFSF